MDAPTAGLLVLAGLGAGLTGSVAGLASLVSYPALLAAGLGPVGANVTNTVALVGSAVGSGLGSRPELAGQGPRLRRLCAIGAAGGLLGGALLLVTPAGGFARVVPWLIGGASVAILLRPQRAARELHPDRPHPRALDVAVLLVGAYGGYFGAAAGVLMLAVLLAVTGEPLPRSNAVKNVVLGVANGVAAIAFAVLGPVHWAAAVPLGAGFLAGGRLGPVVVRHAPVGVLRTVIAGAGLVLAVRLGLQAY
ncbi:hypothetical protein EV189_0229 [Motilibacter rhizosphaerae]|uniref:Probable membrane transporter protein n=1 Tax=Motilibacter rhizosphaerae TaxID=598652 RepID=A0A4Q7NVT9_9ACTN|nr:sulfite exporter TauE/SafE family protein [Motilibacter rhizosphaerae]RZS90998.1 hypothetical protein EV189_0229 [Motilibacter rhizosphaerae]